MAKFLLVAAAAVVTTWLGGGEMPSAAAHPNSGLLFFNDELPLIKVKSKEKPGCLSSSGSEVCENDPEYDDRVKQRVLALLERDANLKTLLHDPSLRTILNDVEPRVDTVSTRFGSVSETPLCSAQETLIYPKRGKLASDEWVFVLNQENAVQALRVEKCINEGSDCGVSLPLGAKATCRQKHVYRRVLVLGSNNIKPEEVLMPSCCVCYTTYDALVTRSRNATREQKPPTEDAPAAAPTSPAASGSVMPSSPGHPMELKFTRSLNNRSPAFVRYPFRR